MLHKAWEQGIGNGSFGGGVPPKKWWLGDPGGMRIFEPWPHRTCVYLRDHVVQIMASQRTLDTWLPAAKKNRLQVTGGKKYTPCNVTRLRMEEV